jgi:hypothetical protein
MPMAASRIFLMAYPLDDFWNPCSELPRRAVGGCYICATD